MEKYSKQREEIIQVLKESYTHPTAEEIYRLVKEKNSTASKGTVYRNLLLLIQKGIVKKISMPDRIDRYDYVRKLHNHVVCKECGKIKDFYYDFKEELIKEIEKQSEIEISLNDITVQGICKDCRLAKENNL